MCCALNCGIVGLPNVGKSTLFNILTKTQAAEAANYPFCTIEPNTAKIAIKDERLEKVAKLVGSKEIIFPQICITDIAGLVKGASKGEGLGNQFLSHIREVDAIIHVLRFFDDKDVIHVDQNIDPVFDKEIIESELMISDLESLKNRKPKLEKRAKQEKDAQKELEFANRFIEMLENEEMLNNLELNPEDKSIVNKMNLLTTKPMIYLLNVSETQFLNDEYKNSKFYKTLTESLKLQQSIMAMPIKFESDFIGMDEEERKQFIIECGISPDNIQNLIKKCYDTLNLHSFFTVGPKEARSWQIKKNCTAPEAAGEIHSDIQRGFIRAEVISYDDYIFYQSEQNARNHGKLRSEGKEYIVHDADIINFLHSA